VWRGKPFPKPPRFGDLFMLIDDLLDSLRGDADVRHIMVGAHLTVVCSRRCGLASTLSGGQVYGRPKVKDAGSLHRKSARELAEYARSDNSIEGAIGLAALNSLLQEDEERFVRLNAAEYLASHGRGAAVALVGHFPFVERLRPAVGELWVLELAPEAGDFPASMAAQLLPRADVVGITGSTLVNHTLDELLGMCRPDVPIVLIGPTTPMSPVLFDHGVTVLAGTRVRDEALVLRSVSQGASLQQVEGVERVSWVRDQHTRTT